MGRPIRIFAYVWNSHKAILDRIRDDLGVEVVGHCPTEINNSGATAESIVRDIRRCDASLICWQASPIYADVMALLEPYAKDLKIIHFCSDPSKWKGSTVDMALVTRVAEYISLGGDENFRRVFDFIAKKVVGSEGPEPLPPVEVPWQSIVGFRDGRLYEDVNDYIESHGLDASRPFVGIIGSRPLYLMDGLSLERRMGEMILDAGLNPIIIYTMFRSQREAGILSIADCIRKFFFSDGRPLVSAVVKLIFTPVIGDGDPEDFLRSMDVPLYAPVVLSRKSVKEWEESSGLTTDVAWKITLPEFEGFIEPLLIGSEAGWVPGGDKDRVLIEERCLKMVRRIAKNVALQRKPNSEKKVLIFLNNFPCHGAEANIGNAGSMDALESVARILKRMDAEGYNVEVPKDGKELLDWILGKKALSEFRWTTVQEIKRCGGVLYEMGPKEYADYLATLPEGVPEDIEKTWGKPPGEGMVLDGNLLVTGLKLGNAIVALEPKRGCYGTKCDGKVCKILQDPVCAPTHQFMAELHYFNDVWGADIMIHAGSHGCIEFLPGKSSGLSERCYPDICMGDTPHIYIYTSNNPTEGLTAKRRSYATIISHMQNPVKDVELYGGFAEMESMLSEYQIAKNDPTQSDSLRARLIGKYREVSIGSHIEDDTSLEECMRRCGELLSRIRNSATTQGLHVFGDIPAGKDKEDMVYSILKFRSGDDSLFDVVARSMGYDPEALDKAGPLQEIGGRSADSIRASIRSAMRAFVSSVLNGSTAAKAIGSLGLDIGLLGDFERLADTVRDVSGRIDASDEMGSLMRCMSGRYIPPSPSGYITRGGYDVLPTGRNFYSMNPDSVPFRTAWESGRKLGEATIQRYRQEEGKLPETIGFSWYMTDILVCGGETLSQIMHLMGTEPVWEPDGRVKTFRVIPLEELGRPRIDATITVSNILLDNMERPTQFLNEVIERVAELDEPPEMNFVRKHTQESIAEGMTYEEASTRMFGSGAGCGSGGLYLAVLASAWKDDKDLVDFHISNRGYGYGGERRGKPMAKQYARMLSLNDLAFDKVHSDEVDALSSGRYSTVGGMVIASRLLSGKQLKTYYGDTSDPRASKVRSFSEEIERVMDTKVFNPQWIEAMKKAGYSGASEITKRVTRLYGWQATTRDVDSKYFDMVTDKFVRDEEMYRFFKENNIYSAGELVRRLLEAQSRGLWDASEEDLALLRGRFLDLEADLEGIAGDGEYQGGSIDIYRPDSLPEWEASLKGVSELTEGYVRRRAKE